MASVVVSDRYHVLRELGAGAAGRVLLALDTRTSRQVALKILRDEAAGNDNVVEAFRAEARLSRDLTHPNLVGCVDANLNETPPWIAFEYVVGTSLDTLLEQKGFLEPNLAVSLILDVAFGLAAAHQKGVLHRDIKPQNILVTPAGEVKLIDFGAAKILEDTPELLDLDATARSWAGTRTYASPEQLQGKEIDERSDLYSLGLVLYEMLTGQRAVEPAPLPRIVMQQIRLPKGLVLPSSIHSDIPTFFDDAVTALLAFEPDDRLFDSAVDLAEAFQGYARQAGIESSEQRAQRVVARLELADTDFWHALNLLEAHRYQEGLILLRSFLDLPKGMGDTYRKRVPETIYSLVDRLHAEYLRSGDGGFLRTYLSTLHLILVMAREMDDPDLCAIAERKAATLLTDLPAKERIGECTRFLTVVPDSPSLGLRCYTAIKKVGMATAIAQMRLPLARVCLLKRWYRQALALAAESLREGGDPSAAKVLADLALKAIDSRDGARKLFRRGLSRNRGAAALAVCERHLRYRPWDWQLWRVRACLQVETGQTGAAHSFLEAGRLAFAQNHLKAARAIFAGLLKVDPDNALALRYLCGILSAEGQLPPGHFPPRLARLAIFCQEGIAEGVLRDLDRIIGSGAGGAQALEALAQVIPGDGRDPLKERILLTLGRTHLARDDFENARQCLGRAIEASPVPSALLDEISTLPNVDRALSRLEIARMKQTYQ